MRRLRRPGNFEVQHNHYATPSRVFDNELLLEVVTDAVCIISTDA